MAFVPRKYRPTVTDRETCQLSNLHDFWFLSAGNYHPMMWSLLPVCHPPVPSLFPSSLLSILSISHSTLIQEVWLHEAAERREREGIPGATLMYRTECSNCEGEQERGWSGRGWASITIIILLHLKRWLLKQVLWRRQERENTWREAKRDERLLWLLVNLKHNFIFQLLLLSRTSTQSIRTITKDISAVY